MSDIDIRPYVGVFRDGKRIKLTGRTTKVFFVLYDNQGDWTNTQAISKSINGNTIGYESEKWYIWKLRTTIPELEIETLRGHGYRLVLDEERRQSE